ncbi:MAG: HNH endonuclease [Planctomycetota bacterium]
MRSEKIKFTFTISIPDWLAGPFLAAVMLYRRIRYGYPFRRIPLTRGKYTIVDPEHYERLNKHKWQASKGSNTFYASRSVWDKVNKKKYTIKMHREIITPPYPLVVDHINHNGLDNRKANLRPATKSQNCINKPCIKKKGAHSKYRGVTWQKSINKWQAQIRINGKHKVIGYYKDETAAAREYDKAARKFHGEFAVLNFPIPPGR